MTDLEDMDYMKETKVIKLLKFIDGEEILVEEVRLSTDSITFKNPLRIVMIPPNAPNQPPKLALADWLPYSKFREFKIERSKILVETEPVDQFADEYRRAFSSVIQAKKPGLILPS